VQAIEGTEVRVELRDGQVVARALEHVDKPLETEAGQMLDRVAHGLAEVETTQDKQAEWQQNFRWLLDDWKFVPGGRILTAAGTDQNLTFYNCMPPEQEILAADGYKPIAEVKVGDLVVTHRNRLRRVLHKFERETDESLFIIRAKKLGYDDLRVTGEHKVLAIRSEWVNTHRSRDGLRLQQDAQWMPARELKPGDYVAAAYDGEEKPVAPIYVSEHIAGYEISGGKLFKPQKRSDYHGYLEEGGTKYAINDRLVIDRDLCYLFGRWLGDGCVTHRTKTDIPSGIKIVFGLNEREEAEHVACLIERKFGLPTAVKLSSTERWFDVWANSMPLGQFFKELFGSYSYGKRIPEHLMHLPNDLACELLKGLFSADGYSSGNRLGIVLSNRVLTTQAHQMLLRLGYFFSIKENTHRLGRWPAYRLQATANECGTLFKDFFGVEPPPHEIDLKYYFEHDGLRWVRIDDIAVEDYSGVVLDIEVEEDHSFVSAGLVVSNCYVVPSPHDSRRGIIDTLSQMTEIMSRGGGVGINLSSLRPRHAYVKGVNGRSSGSVSWGALYSFVTGLIEQGGSRRGALMLILNVWHPDVLEFIASKQTMGRITNANISVGITDDFMEAVERDDDWDLVFPDTSVPDYDASWDGNLEAWRQAGRPVVVHKTVRAREIWDKIVESAWASAEPGVFFVERYNKMSNSSYFAPILCTNPCGEQGLPAWGVCNLGALNLSRFVTGDAVDWPTLGQAVRYAVRFLDNVIDATPYFFAENEQQQFSERRVGLGVMGLAEMMIRCQIRYGTPESVEFIDRLFGFIAREAYLASADFAVEKGAFPRFETEKFLQSGFMQGMPDEVQRAVRNKGIRNVTLLTVAPTGTTGTMMNTSTGIEPFYFWEWERKGRLGSHLERAKIYQDWLEEHRDEPLPAYFVTALDLTPEEHIRVQAAAQRWIDSSISKTCNVPPDYSVEQTRALYELMYQLGCKGGTIYRDGSRDEQVLHARHEKKDQAASEPVAKVQIVEAQPRSRPRVLHGNTYRKNTPIGTAYITINANGEGEQQPFEVFINVGKAGSDVAADAEGLGRLISLILRMPGPLGPYERIQDIVGQLRGIGSGRQQGFGKQRVMSLPDAVAQALAEHVGLNAATAELPGLPDMDEATQLPLPAIEVKGDFCPQCGQAAMIFTEGCKKCFDCGYSEC
jgi:ribonucleoside-diphosphate reductase alpha chain